MEMVENGMVVGAEREWESMYEDAPSDKATPADFDIFAWNTDRIADVLIDAFGLEKGDLTEDVAKLIYSGLPTDFTEKCIKGWSGRDSVRREYNKYVWEGN